MSTGPGIAAPSDDDTIVTYYDLLAGLHRRLRPRVYLEIGVHEGHSLRLALPGTRVVGVDPEPRLDGTPPGTTIVTSTSDAFFARSDVDEILGAPPDLVFVDGLHLWEQALRDVAHAERHAHPGTVIAIHDCLPIDAVTSSRRRTTLLWSGDVWKVVVALRRHRPDLNVHTVAAAPTGLALVTGCDPTDRVLTDGADAIRAELDDWSHDDLLAAGRDELLGVVPATWAAVDALLRDR